MIGVLLVLVAHGLDALTFLMAVERHGIHGEWGVLGLLGLGVGAIVPVKAVGTAVLGWIIHLRPRYLLLGAGAGLLGAITNLSALFV